MDEWVIWEVFRRVQSNALVLVKLSSEFVAVYNSEHSAIDLEILSQVQISPCVELSAHILLGNFVAFQKDSLWDARIFNSLFNDVKSVIVKVVVNDAFS